MAEMFVPFFLLIFSFLIGVKGGDVCRTLHFFPSVAGKALAGHVFETIQVKSSEQCEIRCYRDHQCFSVNLGPYQVNGHACELSKSDHVRNPDDLVLRPGYIYKGTENGCSSCPNNATCYSLTPETSECLCPAGFTGMNCETGESCRDIKTRFPYAQDGMYQVQPDGALNVFWVYCDMTSFGGGWTMCYSTDNLVNPKTEVTYDDSLPYGTNGYRSDCNNVEFREILFVDEETGERAFFSNQLDSTLVAAENYGTQLTGLWVGGGIAETIYEYQLLICDTNFFSGFLISGKYPNCYKQCANWCGDTISPYFRSASTSSGFAGVAFNVNGHRSLSRRLISVGLR